MTAAETWPGFVSEPCTRCGCAGDSHQPKCMAIVERKGSREHCLCPGYRAGEAQQIGMFVEPEPAAALAVQKSAVISECGRYRYELRRVWDPAGPLLEFIMLNPSTADADIDDPTIRRIAGSEERPGFARLWGYGGVVVRNLFAYRATDPGVLATVADPIGPDNRKYLADGSADCTIVAWGSNTAAVRWWEGNPSAWQRTVIQRPALFCLGTTSMGAPRHPLYVRRDRDPQRWTPEMAVA